MMTNTEYKAVCNKVMGEAETFPTAVALEMAAQLQGGELDGWHYQVEGVTDTHSRIAVYDENGDFVSYWTTPQLR